MTRDSGSLPKGQDPQGLGAEQGRTAAQAASPKLLSPEPTSSEVEVVQEKSPFVLMDTRTGRPAADHGSAELAIEHALDGRNHDNDAYNQTAFLQAWSEGAAFEEWPDFYDWLKGREAALTPTVEGNG